MALPLITTQRHARAEEGLALAWQAVPGAMRYGLIIGLADVPLPPLDVVMKGAQRSFTIMGIPVRFTGAVDVGSPVGEDRQYSLIAYRGDGTIVPVPGVGYYPARQAPRDREYHLLQPPALAAEPQPAPAPPEPAPEPVSGPAPALDEFGDPVPVAAEPIDRSIGPTSGIPAEDAAPVERRPRAEFAAATAGPAPDASLVDSMEEPAAAPVPAVTTEAVETADSVSEPSRAESNTTSPAQEAPLFASAVSVDDTVRQPAAEPSVTVPVTVERQDGGTGWSDAAAGRPALDEREAPLARTAAPTATEPSTSEDQAGHTDADKDRIGRESAVRVVGAGADDDQTGLVGESAGEDGAGSKSRDSGVGVERPAGEGRDGGVGVERPVGDATVRAPELAALLDEAELHLRWAGGDERDVARLLDQARALDASDHRLHELQEQLRQRQEAGSAGGASPPVEQLLAEARRLVDKGDYWPAVDLYTQVLAVQEHNDEARQGVERARTLALWTALMAGSRRDAWRLRRIGNEFAHAPDLAAQSFDASFALRPTVAALQGWLLALARDNQGDAVAETARHGVETLRSCGRVEVDATPAQERALARIQSEARAGTPGALSTVEDAVADLAAALEAVRLSAD